jgi:hypothetical protein
MKKRIAIHTFVMTVILYFVIDAVNPRSAETLFNLSWAFAPALASAFISWIIWNFDVSYQPFTATQADDTQTQDSGRSQSTTEKRKRETLDNVLRDLSDEQLDTLRRRLQDGTIDDDVLERRIVGADGELTGRR